MQTAIQKHLFSISDYDRMAERGLFNEDSRIELIEGEFFDMAPIGSRHASIVSFLASALIKQLSDRAIVRIQDPVRLGDFSVPQPDLVAVEPKTDFYRTRHPEANEILLLIEVSDSTANYDLNTKIPLYAKYAIPECWLIDIDKKTVTRFTEPLENSYKMQHIYHADESVQSIQFDCLSINLGSLLD